MIALNEPNITGNEIKEVKSSIKSTWVSTSGKYIKRFESLISNFTNSKNVVALSSGTSALHLSLRAIDIKKNEEIIVPAITFIATINSINYVNASPIFMDVDKTHNLDINKTIKFIKEETFTNKIGTFNKKTKKRIGAIIPVHMWGNYCDFQKLKPLCKQKKIKIIEDASEALGTFQNKKNITHAGTNGDIGCLSFNGNKILTTGAGGAIITNNYSYAKKILYLSTQAKDDAIRFVHNDIGYNYRMTNLNAAFGCGQFKSLKKFIKNKKKIHDFYKKKISKLNGINLLENSNHFASNNWLNIIEIDKNKTKINPFYIYKKLKEKNIQTRLVWMPNHLQKQYKNCQKYKIKKSVDIFNKSLCIPSSTNLTKYNLNKIYTVLKKILIAPNKIKKIR